MAIKNFIKKLTYSPLLSKIVWRLHIAPLARRAYFYINRPRGGVISLSVGGISAKFFVHSPWELRALEPEGKMGNEKHILEVLESKIKRGDVIFDVGSNFGIYTIFLAKKSQSGKVAAFEPEEESYNNLQDNVKLNNLTNVISINIALGNTNEETNLYLGQVTGASSLVRKPGDGRGVQKVKTRKGDDIIAEKDLPIPKLVKIDVEGGEYDVLRGMEKSLSDSRCKYVCCEIHPQNFPEGLTVEKIFRLLESFGFKKIKEYKRGTSEFHILAEK